jgi:hypothetical protein
MGRSAIPSQRDRTPPSPAGCLREERSGSPLYEKRSGTTKRKIEWLYDGWAFLIRSYVLSVAMRITPLAEAS